MCLAVDEPKPVEKVEVRNEVDDVDPETFLFEDDEEDEDFVVEDHNANDFDDDWD